jgi:type II secretory pathway pseudopilin PulG
MSTRLRSQRGFTLVEALVATGVTVVVTAAVFDVLRPSGGLFQAQPEASDMQQRLRVAVDQLTHDLMNAGAGSYSGLTDTTNDQMSRSLVNYFAPVLPYVQSSNANDDGRGRFFSSRITLVYVPTSAAQAALTSDMASNVSTIHMNRESRCGLDPLCGFRASGPDSSGGTRAVIYDGSGAFDEFVVTSIDATAGNLELQHTGLSQSYKVPAHFAEAVSHSYFLKSETKQLMYDDGLGVATPVLDNVIGMSFEYYGESSPTAFLAPNSPNLSTTYGPAPPGLDAQTPIGSWPKGENCVWSIQQVDGMPTYVSRLPPLRDGDRRALVLLKAQDFTDGPWCPDALNSNRYDADLLRIRKIRVTLRLQTGTAALRGSGSLAEGPDALFANPGTATLLSRAVPDRGIRFDVSPRNLNLGR